MKNKAFQLLRKDNLNRCIYCRRTLQEHEKLYYGCSCEKCENKITKKLSKE